MNKIAVVSMVKNEQDIIESFVRHSMLFADKLYICDHKSSDETRQIIEQLSDEFDIEISSFDKDEKAQAKIINELAHQAIDDGFDLIIPLDADEFIIYSDGDSEDLRKHLQNLDSNDVYLTYLWEYRFEKPDEDEDLYTLSRSAMKHEEISDHNKILIGRKYFLQNEDKKIMQGNHALADIPESEYTIDEKIFYAHYSCRSENQIISKYLLQWLSNSLTAGRYGMFGQSAKMFSLEYFEDPSTPQIELDITNLVSADLEKYKNECFLKYYGGGMKINPLRNIFYFAEDLVNSFNFQKILYNNETVRVFILYDGDDDRYQNSLKSVQNQTYPLVEIFKIDLKNEFDYNKIVQSDVGTYIQFVLPGDILHPESIKHCVEFMHSNWNPEILFTDFLSDEHFSNEFTLSDEIEEHFKTVPGRAVVHNLILFELIQQQRIMMSGISRGFFKQKIFNNAYWIQNWLEIMKNDSFCIESSSAFFMTNVMMNHNIHFFVEQLIKRGCKNWTQIDFLRYNEICEMIIKQLQRR